MKKLFLLAGVTLVATLSLAACSGSKKTTDGSGAAETAASSTSMKEANDAKRAKLNALDLPQLSTEVAADEDEVEMVTSMGTVKIKLFPKLAPKAVENFMTLTKKGYYDGLTFHRVIKDFMIQGGDPKGDGTGGESMWGKGFGLEVSDQLYHIRGALAMAHSSEPDSNGSQFYIVQNDKDVKSGLLDTKYPSDILDAYTKGGTPDLDGSYTVFGQVIEGMDVVDKIAAVKTETGDKPATDVKITKITVVQEAK